MKYIIMQYPKNNQAGDLYTEEYGTLQEAVDRADLLWNKYLTTRERGKLETCILESANPDEDAPDHFDGNVVWTPDAES